MAVPLQREPHRDKADLEKHVGSTVNGGEGVVGRHVRIARLRKDLVRLVMPILVTGSFQSV